MRGGPTNRDVVAWVNPADAFATALAEHGDRLARLAYFLCGDRSRAEDLVAEAFASAWPKWSAGRVDDLGPYLRRIVVNQASKARRHWRVVVRHDERSAQPVISPGRTKDSERAWTSPGRSTRCPHTNELPSSSGI